MRNSSARIDEPSLFSRVLGALVAFVFSGLTVVSLPWLLAWKFPIRLGLLVGIQWLPFVPIFYIWVLVVALFALHMGFKLGGIETLDVLNLLWKTGESHDPTVQAMAGSLRTTIIWSGIGTFVLLCLR